MHHEKLQADIDHPLCFDRPPGNRSADGRLSDCRLEILTAIAEMEIDPAIPALVVVGKRLTRQATAAPTDGHGQSTMAVQDGAAPRTGSAQVVTAAGL